MSGLHIRAGALETVLDLDSTPTLHIRERTHFHFGEGLLLPKSQERHIYIICASLVTLELQQPPTICLTLAPL